MIDPRFDEDLINEVFTLPIGLREVIKIDGQSLYGSDKLNEKVGIAFGKSGRTKPVAPKLIELMKKQTIVPCFFTKGLIGYSLWKIFAPTGMQSMMGFYAFSTKKIYLLIQNNVNVLGYVSNNFLALLTVHELMHLIADWKTAGWFRAFESELIEYYNVVWKTIFSLNDKIDKKLIQEMVKWLFFKVERSSFEGKSPTVRDYYNQLGKLAPYTTISSEQFDQLRNLYLVAIKLYMQGIEKFLQARSQLRAILGPLYGAYREAFGMRNLSTICIQELIYPSEVIAIYSEDMSFKKPLSVIKAM